MWSNNLFWSFIVSIEYIGTANVGVFIKKPTAEAWDTLDQTTASYAPKVSFLGVARSGWQEEGVLMCRNERYLGLQGHTHTKLPTAIAAYRTPTRR